MIQPFGSLAATVGPIALRSLARTWRFAELDQRTGSLSPPRTRTRPGTLYALWHQQLLMLMLRHRDEDIAVMISRSRDGDVATPIVERLGFEVVRGSSSRGGGSAMREMSRAVSAGHPLALTIDGPRGPARRCKPGAVLIAMRSGASIVPTVAIPERGVALRSWDRFLVPLPGTRVLVSYGDPLRPAEGESEGDVERWQRRIESSLAELIEQCERVAGRDWPGEA